MSTPVYDWLCRKFVKSATIAYLIKIIGVGDVTYDIMNTGSYSKIRYDNIDLEISVYPAFIGTFWSHYNYTVRVKNVDLDSSDYGIIEWLLLMRKVRNLHLEVIHHAYEERKAHRKKCLDYATSHLKTVSERLKSE